MENENLPVYALRFSAYGERSLIDAVLYTGERGGFAEPEASDYALAFQRGLREATGTLATFPLRFPVASEAVRMEAPPNLPRPDEEASLAFSRPAYKHTFTTTKGKPNR